MDLIELLNISSITGLFQSMLGILGNMFMAFFSALPFYFSAYSISYTDAFFESMSGLTTTGASILGQPVSLYELNVQFKTNDYRYYYVSNHQLLLVLKSIDHLKKEIENE